MFTELPEPLKRAARWKPCKADANSYSVASYRTDEPVEAIDYTPEQVGRLTYMATCSGCHSVTSSLVGPPMTYVRAMYKDSPEKLAAWIAAPVRRNRAYTEMPPQDYLPKSTRLAVARYILEELDK
ncbi:MAG: hypothetical protein GY725_11045 [bacterium]|nr:hypothetical protein [bacterium]